MALLVRLHSSCDKREKKKNKVTSKVKISFVIKDECFLVEQVLI